MIIAVVLAAIFWICAGLLAYTHVGYPLLLALLTRAVRRRETPAPAAQPPVSLVIAAYNEQAVIRRKVENARALDYPDLEVIVASDGSADRTAQEAAGADVVLELPRGGKVRAQDAGVERARGEIVAFSDANSFWEPDALRALVAPFADPSVGYVCGQVRFTSDGGDNQEGAYWRYEMWIRRMESQLAGVTGGNGAIYAVRKDAYIQVDPRMGHDLSFPFNLVKRGWKPVYAPAARATEKMVPSIEGEFRRKRRMQSHMWPILLTGGLIDPRGYGLLYALEIFSHRLLRYLTPLLHLVAFAVNIPLLGHGGIYVAAFLLQCVLLGFAVYPVGPLRFVRYYVAMTAAIGIAFFDWLRSGTPAGWEQAEGTR